jgi:hypothetical protein
MIGTSLNKASRFFIYAHKYKSRLGHFQDYDKKNISGIFEQILISVCLFSQVSEL